MSRVEFEPTTPVFERAKAVHVFRSRGHSDRQGRPYLSQKVFHQGDINTRTVESKASRRCKLPFECGGPTACHSRARSPVMIHTPHSPPSQREWSNRGSHFCGGLAFLGKYRTVIRRGVIGLIHPLRTGEARQDKTISLNFTCFQSKPTLISDKKLKLNSVTVVRKRTIPTERPPLVGEVNANLCG
jgi:hypothetical protein